MKKLFVQERTLLLTHTLFAVLLAHRCNWYAKVPPGKYRWGLWNGPQVPAFYRQSPGESPSSCCDTAQVGLTLHTLTSHLVHFSQSLFCMKLNYTTWKKCPSESPNVIFITWKLQNILDRLSRCTIKPIKYDKPPHDKSKVQYMLVSVCVLNTWLRGLRWSQQIDGSQVSDCFPFKWQLLEHTPLLLYHHYKWLNRLHEASSPEHISFLFTVIGRQRGQSFLADSAAF